MAAYRRGHPGAGNRRKWQDMLCTTSSEPPPSQAFNVQRSGLALQQLNKTAIGEHGVEPDNPTEPLIRQPVAVRPSLFPCPADMPEERESMRLFLIRCDILKVHRAHLHMDPKRFPNDWATAENLKQCLKNCRRYAVKKGQMPRRKVKLSNAHL
ncbi:hypothetical protein CPC08DRAFT_324617 [Agrocybe pediades]|nr:hypothetical protein CPC08DRAFT_324617 [Agrocybe pediades]